MKKKTIGWLMMSPVIVAWVAFMFWAVGWMFIPLALGVMSCFFWIAKAFEFILSKD